MATKFKKVAILGRHEDPRVAEPITVLAKYLGQSGVEVLAAEEMSLGIEARRLPEEDLAVTADLIIAIGGDGAMLYAGQLARRGDIPLLGINRGRLGFLADVTPEEMLDSVGLVLAGDFTTDKRLVLEARLERPNTEDTTALALNDVVLQRRETGRMLDFVTRMDGRYVNTHAGDGLVIATPTGSTAYSLSCGGPIIEPQLDAIVLVPICPHTLSDRPVVIPAAHNVEISLREREDTNAEITVDGHFLGELLPADRLTISSDATRISLIHPPGYDYYEILRSKLHWGRDSRKRNPGDRV